tara:strand:+ start:545 stop:1204 length:660 start_codon:yes stop_codon:yes gene_type:complete
MEFKQLSWFDCTVGQFQDVQDIISQTNITPTDFVLEVGDVFFDLDEDMSDSELRKLKQSISFITKPVICKLNTKNLKSFNKLSIAKFIDLDVLLVSNSFIDALPKVTKLLYDFDDVEDVKLTDVYKAFEDYIKYRSDVYKKYPNLFDANDDEEEDYESDEEEEETKPLDPGSVWMRTIFAITQGDITKYTHVMGLPHILVFNWVSLSESLKTSKQTQIQ